MCCVISDGVKVFFFYWCLINGKKRMKGGIFIDYLYDV